MNRSCTITFYEGIDMPNDEQTPARNSPTEDTTTQQAEGPREQSSYINPNQSASEQPTESDRSADENYYKESRDEEDEEDGEEADKDVGGSG